MSSKTQRILLGGLCGALCTSIIYTSATVIVFGTGYTSSQAISEAVPYGAVLGMIYGLIFALRDIPPAKAALWQGLVTGGVQVLLHLVAAVVLKFDLSHTLFGVLVVSICVEGLGGAVGGATGRLLHRRLQTFLPAS